MSQCSQIIAYIKENGYITAEDAFRLGITQLATRIFELKKNNWHIVKEMVSGTNRYGKVIRYARYYIIEEDN